MELKTGRHKIRSTMIVGLVVLFLFMLLTMAVASGEAASTPAKPVPPAQVTADAGNQRVTLSWSPVSDATSYSIYLFTTPGYAEAKARRIEAKQSPHVVRNLSNGTMYYFVITSVGVTAESEISNEVRAVPSLDPPPPAPKDVVVEPQDRKVRISWSPSAGATSQATSYDVYYATSPGVIPRNATKVANAFSPRTVAPLKLGVTYYFVVTASNEYGESAPSFEVSATPAPAGPPLTPNDVTAVLKGDGRVVLSWPQVPGAISYNVYYQTRFPASRRSPQRILNVASSDPVVSTTLEGLSNRTAYFFAVTALNGSGESTESRNVSATPLAAADELEPPSKRMVLIPAGPFEMGDTLDRTLYAQPVHTVNLDAFYIDRYETTYDLWREVYNWALQHGYKFDNPGLNGSNGIGTNMPVTVVNWYDVVKWLNARSEKEGRTTVYYTDATQTTVYRTGRIDLQNACVRWSANGFRLPTEAEWEKAARGGLKGMRYPWGNELAPHKANYGRDRTGNPSGIAFSVGLYTPNGYGLYDMAGNVHEWVWDWGSMEMTDPMGGYRWVLDGQGRLPLVPLSNPYGPDKGVTRVRRGGGYAEGEAPLKVFERVFRSPNYLGPYFGFRSASSSP
jgi:formylglycine-generating enzyme required for sulfatase activity